MPDKQGEETTENTWVKTTQAINLIYSWVKLTLTCDTANNLCHNKTGNN